MDDSDAPNQSKKAIVKAARKILKKQDLGSMKLKELAKLVANQIILVDDDEEKNNYKKIKRCLSKSEKLHIINKRRDVCLSKKKKRNHEHTTNEGDKSSKRARVSRDGNITSSMETLKKPNLKKLRSKQQQQQHPLLLKGMVVAVSTLKEEEDRNNNTNLNSSSSFSCSYNEICRKLKANGADVVNQVCKRVQILVCTENAVRRSTQRVRKAIKQHKPLVSVAWIDDIHTQKRFINYYNDNDLSNIYILHPPPPNILRTSNNNKKKKEFAKKKTGLSSIHTSKNNNNNNNIRQDRDLKSKKEEEQEEQHNIQEEFIPNADDVGWSNPVELG